MAHSFHHSGQTFDCIPIDEQPAVRLRGLTSEATPPPAAAVPAPLTQGGTPPTTDQNNQEAGSQFDDAGNLRRCEPGTIPVRRVTLEEMSRFKTLKHFFAKGPGDAGRFHPPTQSAPPSFDGHWYAITYQTVNNYGGFSVLNLWRPYVSASAGQGFSLSQQWYSRGSGAQVQTAEVGWQNYPAKYGTENSALFIYWTADGYRTTGCYNLDCGAFFQFNNNYRLGGTWGAYSSSGGPQVEIALGYFLYQGNWWLQLGNDIVGYYPPSVYRYGPFTSYADTIEFGGETFGTTSYPPMGSGAFPAANYGYAAYQRLVLWRDALNNFYDASLGAYQPFPGCYLDSTPWWGGSANRTFFYFGGPGGRHC